MLLPIKDQEVKPEVRNVVLLMSLKELLTEVKKKEEPQFIMVGKPKIALTSTRVDDLPEEIQQLLEEFVDIVVDELPHSLPPIRSISHHIDLIPGASLPNKVAYRLTPQENEEVKRQVQYLMDKGLIRERLSPCDADRAIQACPLSQDLILLGPKNSKVLLFPYREIRTHNNLPRSPLYYREIN
jgi:hypothetical protein